MDNRRNLNPKISAFYDDYHRGRIREANDWMKRTYWPAFTGKTLEVGGGTLHPERDQYMVVDLSQEAMVRAQAKAIPAAIANGSQLPFATGAFDTLACYDVLEHVVEPEPFIAEMCRVAKQRVVIAGPNYIMGTPGNLDRRLPGWAWKFLTDPSSRIRYFDNPYLSFDENWHPDRDEVTGANAAWVADQIRRHGFQIRHLRTWEIEFHWLNHVPIIRALGRFMFVMGAKE